MKRPMTVADFERAKVRWAALGWQEIPEDDETTIKAAWIAHLQPAGEVIVPKPSRSWRRISVAELGGRAEEIEADFTLKVLAAFRRCARAWASGCWLSTGSTLGTTSTRTPASPLRHGTSGPCPSDPDGDSYNYIAPDFRFGSLTDGNQNWSVSLFGAKLLAAFDADPPERFLRACGPGQAEETEQAPQANHANDGWSARYQVKPREPTAKRYRSVTPR